MERVKFDYFFLPVYFIFLFLVLELFLFTFFNLNSSLLYVVAALLFVFAFFLMRRAGKTNSIKKEIFYSVTAGIFSFYSLFAIPIFTGIMKFTQSAFLFLILFVLFIVAEKGSFRNVLVNITVSLMLLFEMIFFGKHGSLYFVLVLCFSGLLCGILGWLFLNAKPSKFESRAILQTVFSFSAITVLWSVFNLLR